GQPTSQHLPSTESLSLLAVHDGTLWIGTSKGLASWNGSKLRQYPELAGQRVVALFEDREGTLWAGRFGIPTGRLCSIQKGSVTCYEDYRLGRAVFGLYEDSKGSLWVGVKNGLLRWKPGPSEFYSMPNNPDTIRAFAEDQTGTLLVSTRTGIRRFIDGKIQAYPLADKVRQL